MKKQLLFSAFIFLSFLAKAQNLPQCDSLVINCCAFDSVAVSTITLYASNPSSVLFDYPGFVLFNTTMDTIAKETVVYFGIGTGPQPHTLEIISPLVLPFTGYLNLYTLFYDTLACSFAFTIEDTANGIQEVEGTHDLTVYPNPAVNEVTIELAGFTGGGTLSLSILDILGKEIRRMPYDHSPFQLALNEMSAGIYFLRITDSKNEFQRLLVLVQRQ